MIAAALPLWRDDVARAPRRPPLSGDRDADVVIVGAGYTGLWTAWYLRVADPTLRILVVEAEHAGFGASGRNGGWCSAFLPMGLGAICAESGRDAAVRMQREMFATVERVGRTATELGIACDFARGGTVTVARNELQSRRIAEGVDEQRAFGFGNDDVRLLLPEDLDSIVRMRGAIGGSFSPHCAALHPAKLVAGLATAVEQSGVTIHERTRVSAIESGIVRTAVGTVRAPVVVRATEAWTSRLDGLRRAIAPVYSLMIATEPLPESVLADIGLDGRATFSDGRRVVVYGQRTADGRLAFGGRGAPYHFGSAIRPEYDSHLRVHEGLAATLRDMFPVLRGAAITHRWGGPVGVPRDWHCSVGYDRARGVAWAGGYVGDGVATSNLAGRTLADLITGRHTELTGLPWVGHRSPQWEPEPLRWLGINGMVRLPGSIDRSERRGRPARVRGRLLDRMTGH